jgi:hypothetical protein
VTDARSLIMGSGSPGFSFNYPGDTVTGQILTEPKAVQARDFASGQPAFWPSGDPKMQTVFQIQTALRNYEGIKTPDRMRPDDGVRTIYLKGKWMEKATKEAILAARASWLDIGGWVQFTYTGDDMESKAGNKPKLFDVKYQPPAQAPQQPQAAQYQPNGYQNQGYPQQQAPRPPQQAQPAWQQPGWRADQVAQPAPPQHFAPATFNQTTPGLPTHHGQPEAMPGWAAGPASAPPAPSSAPPAPVLSTMDAIRAAQASGTPDYGSVQPTF